MPLWDFIGSTMVTNQYVRLTSDHQSKKGAIWNSVVSRAVIDTPPINKLTTAVNRCMQFCQFYPTHELQPFLMSTLLVFIHFEFDSLNQSEVLSVSVIILRLSNRLIFLINNSPN